MITDLSLTLFRVVLPKMSMVASLSHNDMFPESTMYNFYIITIILEAVFKGYREKSYISKLEHKEQNNRSAERTSSGRALNHA